MAALGGLPTLLGIALPTLTGLDIDTTFLSTLGAHHADMVILRVAFVQGAGAMCGRSVRSAPGRQLGMMHEGCAAALNLHSSRAGTHQFAYAARHA